jgi:uncharacterized delta-60 repeat protein
MNKIKSLLLTLVLASLSTTTRPLVINKNTTPKWTWQTTSVGTIDKSFGENGTYTSLSVSRTLSAREAVFAVEIQSDGKIVIAGRGGDDEDWYVRRLNSNGVIDGSFTEYISNIGKNTRFGDVIYAMKIQSDGKIVIAGRGGIAFDWYVRRLNSNGTIDDSFGDVNNEYTVSLGSTEGNIGDAIFAMDIQSDGKIVIAGTGGATNDWHVRRLNSNGTIDDSFGDENNEYVSNISGSSSRSDIIYAIKMQSDGKIIIAGRGGINKDWYVRRLDADGLIDDSFTVYTSDISGVGSNLLYEDAVLAIEIQSDNKIIIAGHGGANRDWYVRRLNSNGTIDESFGDDNNEYTSNLGGSEAGEIEDVIFDMKIQADGKIVIAGTGGANGDWYVRRLNSSGTIDDSFGEYTSNISNSDVGDVILALQIQVDSKIVIAGYGGEDRNWCVRRLLNDVHPLTQIMANGNGGFV